MKLLTRQQELVLTAIGLLLLLGWTVKAWRLAHPVSAPKSGAVAVTDRK